MFGTCRKRLMTGLLAVVMLALIASAGLTAMMRAKAGAENGHTLESSGQSTAPKAADTPAPRPIAYYNLNGNLNDLVTPSRSTLTQVRSTGDSWSYGTGGNNEPYYQWAGATASGSGLTMDISLADPATYSVGLRFSFGMENPSATRYAKIVDFKNRVNDDGVYLSYGKVMFYLGGAKPSAGAVIKKDEVVDILMTRNGTTQVFTVYSVSTVDGNTVLTEIFSITDTTSSTIPPIVDGKYRFGFGYDDKNGEIAKTGRIYAVKAWDKALSTDEIAASMKQPGFAFDGNGSDNGSTADIVTVYNQSAVLPASGFTRTGCTFIGWNTKQDGAGTAYSAGQTVSNVQTHTTLYAQWQAKEAGALFISPDGSDASGTGTMMRPYASVAKAYAAASSSGSTIYLLGNIEQTASVTLNQSKNISIKSWNSAQYLIKRTIPSGMSEADQTAFLRSVLFTVAGGGVTLNNVIIDNGAVWGEGGANNGLKVIKAMIEVQSSAELNLGSGVVLRNSAAGAVLASGTTKILMEGATIQDCASGIGAGISLAEKAQLTMNSGAIRGCRASMFGGAIALYAANGGEAVANLNGGVIENNSSGQNFASAIMVYDKGLVNLNPNGMTITGDIGLMANVNPIKLTQIPAGSKSYTVNMRVLPTDGSKPKIVDGAENSDAAGSYAGNVLKPHFKVANAGWTFGYQQQPEYSDFADQSALYLVKVTAPAAVIYNGSVATPYHSIQAAIDAVPEGGTQTIYILSIAAPSQKRYTIYETLVISGGRNITFNSATVTLDTDDSDGIEHTYAKNADGNQTTVLRGDTLAAEMVRVEAGSFCTANNIVFDGGALWGNAEIKITGVDNVYYVKTNNMGVKANAPVFAVAGSFILENNARIQNNENTYLVFGSEQYGGGVRVSGPGASFTMNAGSAISLCYAREGGAVMNVTKFVNAGKDTAGSTVVVNGGTISGCVSQTKGSAIQTIYGNSVTTVNGGTISGVRPYEDNLGVLTVEEGGKLIIAGGTISNTVAADFAVYVYNRYCDSYSGYLEGNHAAQLELGNATVGKIGLDASGTAQTSGTHPNQRPNLKEDYKIYIVNSSSATAAGAYDVALAGTWNLGNKIVQNKKSNYTIGGLQSNYYGYLLGTDLVVGGMEITQATVGADGKVTVVGKFVGDPAHFTVTVGGVTAQVTVSAGNFTAVTADAVSAGRKDVVLTYSEGSRTLTSKMLITVPETNSQGELTGGVDYGTLESGEKLQYLGTDGAYHDYSGKQLPNDIAIDENGYADFKLVDNVGGEYLYRAYVGSRISVTEPSDEVFGDESVSKTDTTISIATEDGYEYQLVDGSGNVVKLNEKEWNVGTDGKLTFTGLTPGASYRVLAREKGTATKQPGVTKAVEVQTKTAVEQKIDEAKKELDTAAKNAKDAIDALTNLTAEEKNAAKNAIDTANTAAKTAVEGKTSIAEVTAAAGAGKTAIADALSDAEDLAAQNLADAKIAAKNELDAKAQEAKDAIDALSNLTPEEKTAAKNAIDTANTAAKTAVDGKTTVAEAMAAGAAGESAIDGKIDEAQALDARNLADAKTDAKNGLDAKAQEAKDAIDALTNLTAEEKAAAKAAVDAANTAAKTAVDGKATIAEVTAAGAAGESAIGGKVTEAQALDAQNLADAKAAAKEALDRFLEQNCPAENYTAADYAELLNKVNQAKNAIDTAETVAKVAQIGDNAIADFKTVPEKAPAPAVDKAGDRLTGLAPGTYTVTSGGASYTFTVGQDGILPLQGKDKDGKTYDFAGQTVSLVKKGENGFADSNSASVTLPQRVAKPVDVPSSGITAEKETITVKGDSVVSGNKYAVVDENGDIVGEWVTGAGGEDIVFRGLASGTNYRVVVIGKNEAEPDKLPSNPTDGTMIQTLSDKISKNYVWVILCSIFGALLVAEVIFLILKRRKKDGGDDEEKGGQNAAKVNCAAVPVLALISSVIVAPVAGPIIFALVVAAMVAVPVTMRLLNKRKDKAVQGEENSASEQALQNEFAEKMENAEEAETVGTAGKEESGSVTCAPKTEQASAESEEEEEAAEEKRRVEALAEKKRQAEALSMMNEEEAAKREAENAAHREQERQLLLKKAEEERKVRFAEAEQAKAQGEVLAGFRLSRQDVLDRVEEMGENRFDYPVEALVKERQSERYCDSLKCGEWAFGVMFESKGEVVKFMLRLDKDYAESLKKDHPGAVPTGFGNGEDWYKVVVDDTFYAKSEVFAILDSAYAYVLKARYDFMPAAKIYRTDSAAAQADEKVVGEVSSAAAKPDPDVAKVEKAREELDVLLLASLKFKTNKKEITAAAKAILPAAEMEIAERENATKTHLPLADTFYTLNGISDKGEKKKVCFAYTYQLKDDSIKVIVKLPRVYAEKQAGKHGTLCRSKFPAGKGWYVFKLDGSFGTMEELLAIVKRAKTYVESTEDRE